MLFLLLSTFGLSRSVIDKHMKIGLMEEKKKKKKKARTYPPNSVPEKCVNHYKELVGSIHSPQRRMDGTPFFYDLV